jgi:hypothetical protein
MGTEWIKGEWVKGKESALWISQCGPAARHLLGDVAVTLVVAGSVPFAVLLIPAAAGTVEIAGDKACSDLARFE